MAYMCFNCLCFSTKTSKQLNMYPPMHIFLNMTTVLVTN